MIFLKFGTKFYLFLIQAKNIGYLKSISIFECLIHLSLKMYICVDCSVSCKKHFNIRKHNSKYVFSVAPYSVLYHTLLLKRICT